MERKVDKAVIDPCGSFFYIFIDWINKLRLQVPLTHRKLFIFFCILHEHVALGWQLREEDKTEKFQAKRKCKSMMNKVHDLKCALDF